MSCQIFGCRRIAPKIIKLIKQDKISNKDVKYVIDFVKSNKGIDYAESVAKEYSGRAVDIINHFDDSESKTSLINLAKFVVNREK